MDIRDTVHFDFEYFDICFGVDPGNVEIVVHSCHCLRLELLEMHITIPDESTPLLEEIVSSCSPISQSAASATFATVVQAVGPQKCRRP